MALTEGTRLGSYVIAARIGAGGMGEVYRARDTRLGRDVAIKTLPYAVTTDPERLARLEREARMLGALNHPNIATLHGIEDHGEIRALVMELVAGPTLDELIARRAYSAASSGIADALAVARQIADALDAAHQQNIIHRDLKPANVKITPDGVVKVLDFGLAKAAVGDPAGPDGSNAATTAALSSAGLIVGTVGYMSPEQARGQEVDKRADIWAFGSVLYEMLAGRPAFSRGTVSDSIAAVLNSEPDWQALPPGLAPNIRRLLERCLEKSPKRRLRDIGDARHELEDPVPAAATPPVEQGSAASVPPPARIVAPRDAHRRRARAARSGLRRRRARRGTDARRHAAVVSPLDVPAGHDPHGPVRAGLQDDLLRRAVGRRYLPRLQRACRESGVGAGDSAAGDAVGDLLVR